jgi:murein DD-endopeptidase MepM/ murein hydrolase activator NlpD
LKPRCPFALRVLGAIVGLMVLADGPARAVVRADEIRLDARAFQPGELVVVTVSFDQAPSSVGVRAFDRTTTAFAAGNGTWQALVGIDLEQRPGTHILTVETRTGPATRQLTRELEVLPKRFATRRLRVPPEFVDPPPALRDRIEKEAAFLQQVYDEPSPERLWRAPFVRPVPHAANSRFGTRSVFNGKPRSPHAGTDFASSAGTPVKAPNAGRIVAARELFFAGNTVIIDHGLGVFSLLAHLSRMVVREGDRIEAGHIVGRVGATGRVTGAHLHWALRVSGARVDPLGALALVGTDAGGKTPRRD